MSDRSIVSLVCQYPPCGREFLTRHREAKYCSTECAGLSRRKTQPARNCEQCGKSFEPDFRRREQRFCSAECHHKSRKPADRECPHCRKTFTPDRTAARFCSRECAWKGQGRPGRSNNTTCKHGHEWTDETTRWSDGRRHCIPCEERRAATRAANRAANRAATPRRRAQPKPRPKPRPPLPPPVPTATPTPAPQPARPVWRPTGFAPQPLMPNRACASPADPHAQ